MANFWTPQKIKKGFERFRNTNGRLPKAPEIDTLDYLPSARYIQKRFGGLEYLRAELGYKNTHFGKGKFRSAIATKSVARGKDIEEDFTNYLYTIFPADSIHAEENFYANYRIDFHIMTPEKNFGIDIFYAKDIRTLQSSVNIKMKKYQHFSDQLYLTVANRTITQQELNLYTSRKRIPFQENTYLVTLSTLRNNLQKFKRISDGLCSQD